VQESLSRRVEPLCWLDSSQWAHFACNSVRQPSYFGLKLEAPLLDLSIITEELLVGTQLVSDGDFRTLSNLGVRAVLTLQDSRDIQNMGIRQEVIDRLAAQEQIEIRRCPIRDFDPGDLLDKLESCLKVLDELVQEYSRVYVHCTAGINRSAGVVLSYLVLNKGMSLKNAYHLLKSRRPQSSPYRLLLDTLAHSSARRIGFPKRG